jgi:PAS domain S-box-containing protein
LHLPTALNPRRSLRARFALVLGGSGLAFALLTALVVDRYQREQLIDSHGQAMRREAVLMSRGLNLALQERLQLLRDAAATPILASGLMDPGDARLLLETLRSQHPALAWLAITDAQGRIVVATGALLEGSNLAGQPVFDQAMQQPWIGQRRGAGPLATHLGLSGGEAPALIDLGTPLIDFQGRRLGVLVARLRWDWLDTFHASLQAGGRRLVGSETFVLDREDRVLLGPAEWLDRPLPLPALAVLRDGTEARLLDWPRQGDYLTAWGREHDAAAGPHAGLSVVVRQPAALAFHAANVLRTRLLMMGGAGTLAFIALSVWMAGRITRPIQALSEAASRVGVGGAPQFTAMATRRKDEVSELAFVLQKLHLELAHRLAEQQRASERYEALFRHAPVAVCVVQDQCVRMANLAFVQLFAAPDLDTLLGRSAHELVHAEDHALLDARIALEQQRGARAEPLPMLELRILRLDGQLARVQTTAMPMTLGGRPGVQVVLLDITEQRRAQDLLHQREAQLAHTSRMAKVGGWSLDLASGQGRWTDEMARIYELPAQTVPTPELALSYFHGEHRARLQAAVRELLVNGTPYDLELQLQTPAGQVKWVRAQARSLRTESGRAQALEGITQDITDRRAAEEAVRELNARLEQRVAERTAELQAANAELDSFAYAVSHDLRAPLRAMSGFSEALVEDHGPRLDAEARGYLDQIIQASRRMGELIEGLLVLSRSLRGLLRNDDVDLSALAARAVDELRRNEPGRSVTVDIEPGLQVCGDRRMLDAVMNNLLANAWKYTARQPQARIRVEGQQIDGQRWVCVSDNGAGFDMAHAGRLFKAFARLHRQDEFPGIGIGLATVQRIIHRHGGQIAADAAPGRGATFRFTLPQSRSAEPMEPSPP